MKDREIVAAIAAGDPAGLAGAYDKYAEPLHGYCGWMLSGPDRAADAVQGTFIIAAASLGGLRDPRRLRPWLYAVARSQCHRRLRAGEAGLGEAADLAAPPAGRADAQAGCQARRPMRRLRVPQAQRAAPGGAGRHGTAGRASARPAREGAEAVRRPRPAGAGLPRGGAAGCGPVCRQWLPAAGQTA